MSNGLGRYPGQGFRIFNFGGLITAYPEEVISGQEGLQANQFIELIDLRTDDNILALREQVTCFDANTTRYDPISWIHQSEWGEEHYVIFDSGRHSNDSWRKVCKIPTRNVDLVTRTGSDEKIFRLNSNYPARGAFFQDALLVQNGFTPLYPVRQDDKIPSASEQHFEGLMGKLAGVWRQRLMLIHTAGNPREVKFSSILRGAWSGGAGVTQYTPYAGDFWPNLGAKSVIISNDADEYITDAVIWNEVPIIGTNKGLYRIDTNWGSFPITKETGVVARTMCLYRGALMFLGKDDIYAATSLEEVKPLTRNTIHPTIFSGDYFTQNATKINEWICDTYEDWETKTSTSTTPSLSWAINPPAPLRSLTPQRGGYITDAGATPADPGVPYPNYAFTFAQRHSISFQLKDLLPDYDDGVGNYNERHMSNFVRIDITMTGGFPQEWFRYAGKSSDSDYLTLPGGSPFPPISFANIHEIYAQCYLAYKQADTEAGLSGASWSELLNGSSVNYKRDSRALSFVIKIDPRDHSNVADQWFQFQILVMRVAYREAGPTLKLDSNPQIHRIRVSWESAISRGTIYYDYRQQPTMYAIHDKLWLHLTGQTLGPGYDSMTFVMDNRGEWSTYKNLDAFGMAAIEASHGLNQEMHNRFIIGKRFARYTGPNPNKNYPFYIETKEYPDFILSQSAAHFALAKSGKLFLGDPRFWKRLRQILLTYQGAYSTGTNDKVKLQWRSSGQITPYAGIELVHNTDFETEIIDTDRMCSQNYGQWFQYQVLVYYPWTINHGIFITQIMPFVVPMKAKPTIGQDYVPVGDGPPA